MASAVAIPKAKFRYLSAWFCPFAHRATIALEHHSDWIDYEWIEALGWEQRADENNVTGTGKEWWYHWKAEELKRVNPSALVPTLIPVNPSTGQADERKAVFESLVTIEYIDQVASMASASSSSSCSKESPHYEALVPTDDAYETARCRIWADRVNRECCSPYYGVLVRTDPEERRAAFGKLCEGLRRFSQELAKTSGPTFLDNGQLSSVDVALLPWAYRYYVFETYRGADYCLPSPETDDVWARYHEWFNHVVQLEAIKRTLPDKERYLKHIAKYADSSARSKVANAVRRGVAAHEMDDDKDTY